MNRNSGSIVATIAVLGSGCATMQQAPEYMKEELLVRAWVSTCELEVGCKASGKSRRYQGALIHMDADSLTLLAWREPDPAVTLPVGSLERLQLYRGRVPSLKAALRQGAVGALAGAVGGALIGAVTGSFYGDVGEGAAEGAATGAAVGFSAGLYSGIFEGDDHWETVPQKSLYTLYCLTNEKADCKASAA